MNLKLQTQTSKRKLGLSRNIFSVSLVALVAGLPQGADATTLDFKNAAQANPNLIHQWSFDGADPTARRADQKGAAHLIEKGTAANLVYGAAGWDATSDAAKPFRTIPGSDNTPGHATFQNTSITLGTAMSFEALFRPTEAQITGGSFNLGYILSTRVGNFRGYFLFQGSPSAAADGNDLGSTIGSSVAASNENTLQETIVANNWYYAAGSYTTDGTNTTFTNYFANLTAGDTTLTTVGPITVAGSYPTTATPVGIGGRYDGGEAFPGSIDEVNLFNTNLSSSDFQAHLTQLAVVPEPSTVALLSLGLLSLARRRRPATAD